MKELSDEYLALFNAITDAEQELQKIYAQLIYAQRRAEEIYLSESDDNETKSA